MNTLASYIEAVLETYLFEEVPTQNKEVFDVSALKALKELPQVIGYSERLLGKHRLGQNQGRAVYGLGDGKILKVAQNQNGLAQNHADITIYNSPDVQDIIPRIFDSDSQSMWLIAEEAAPMSRTNFEKLTGISWSEFVFAIGGVFPKTLSANTKGQIRQRQAAFDKHYANRFFRRVIGLIENTGYEPNDIIKLSSWGIARGTPVVVYPGSTDHINKTLHQG